MADIFISYSKKHAPLTEELARDLEAEGYTTWWDTRLLPDDVFFPDSIRNEIAAAKAVIVIWAEHSIASRWVYSAANEADKQGKLLQVRDETLDPHRAPLPFNSGNIPPVTERAKIFAALKRCGVAPSNAHPAPEPRHPPAPVPARPRAKRKPAGRVRVLMGAGQQAREVWLKPGESFRDLDIAPEMVLIPSGEFLMGSKDGEGYANERPQHKVTIPQAFAASKYPVTFEEWDAALAAGGVKYKPEDQGWGRGRRPVIDVSWNDTQAYVKWLSEKTHQPYRLLSEAEWEYACRAGSRTAYFFGDSAKELGDYAWYSGNSGMKAHPVGEKKPNAFGLHDMHGNIWEWCEDEWHNRYVGKPEILKGNAGAWMGGSSSRRVARGGSWVNTLGNLRSAYRDRNTPDDRNDILGFRVGRTLNP